jgi:hypothetical protein
MARTPMGTPLPLKPFKLNLIRNTIRPVGLTNPKAVKVKPPVVRLLI